MKISSTKKVLEHVFSIAELFTGKNLNLPVLSNLLLKVENDNVEVVATNLEYAIQVSLPARIQKKGCVTVPAKVLSQLIQSIKEEQIDLEEKQGNLLVKTDHREVKINGVPVDDFPLVPNIKSTFNFKIDPRVLVAGLLKVLPAVSTSEFKPELGGVFFKAKGEELCLVATDTFRLAECRIDLEENKSLQETVSFIVPFRVAQELVRVLEPEDEALNVLIGENQALFVVDGKRITSRLIEGNFPDYGGIIPRDFRTSNFLNRDEFISAIRSSSIFSSKLQDVILDFGPKALTATSQNPEVGTNQVVIPCSSSGKSVRISFNYKFLLDGLGAMEEEVFLGCNEESSPALLRNRSSDKFVYVVMPIRVS